MSAESAAEPNFGNMARQMGKTMDQFHTGFFGFRPNETWTPSVNLYEDETGYILCVDLAGVDKNKIDVVVAENQLRLRGQRPVPLPPQHADQQQQPGRLRVHLMEIDNGGFSREVELPQDVNQDAVQATYRNGMLWIVLPKK